MFSGLYFSYDGELSKFYGIKILDFEGIGKFNNSILSTTVETTKPARSPRFFRVGYHDDAPPTFTLTVVSETVIDDGRRREILSWLYNRSDYKKFQVYQADLLQYYYKCIFTSAEAIFINGKCYGFSLTGMLDSNYQYGEPSKLTFTQPDSLGYLHGIYNYSDIPDGFVYPKITLSPGAGRLDITECYAGTVTHNTNRVMTLENIPAGVTLEIDCALKTIKSSGAAYSMSNFSGVWTRLYKGNNILHIVAPTNVEVTIECPNYSLVGF